MKEDQVYEFVKGYLLETGGRSPSYEDIMRECKITSKSTVRHLIAKLVTSGRLERHGEVRGLRLAGSKLIFEEDA